MKKNEMYKLGTAIIVTAIIVFIIAAFAFKYYPEMKKEHEVEAYKKAAYNTIICQYNCPLSTQFVPQLNRTEVIPDEICVQNCSVALMNVNASNIKSEDLVNDNLALDIQNTLKNCKAESQVYNTSVGNAVNTALFFSCARRDLEALKNDYTYLK